MRITVLRRWTMVTVVFGAALGTAFADGGVVLREEVSGPYRVTLFGSPAPLRAGPADLSVFVQDAKTGAPVLDHVVTVSVTATAEPASSEAWAPPCCSMKVKTSAVTATHAAAQNKLLYAADVIFPASGPHDLTVTVRPPGADPEKPAAATLTTAAQIAPPAPPLSAYWAYLAAPPFLIAGFALHQRLRRRGR